MAILYRLGLDEEHWFLFITAILSFPSDSLDHHHVEVIVRLIKPEVPATVVGHERQIERRGKLAAESVVGLNDAAFERAVREVLRKHLGDVVVEFVARKSSGGKYLSVTAPIVAGSREQVDAIYRELNGHDLVVMTL